MISLAPCTDPEKGAADLRKLIHESIDKTLFKNAIRNLNKRFEIYSKTFPAPLIAPGLIVTPEIRRQSEVYLPTAEISRAFNLFYRHAQSYPPVLSSTPFYKALSWADVFVALPSSFQFSANPALLLEALLSDKELMTEFLFHSFLPRRFYGGFGRYLRQSEFIQEWLGNVKKTGNTDLRCLDAACGTGEDTYGLVNLAMRAGFSPEKIQIEGWSLEPLEVWAAAHQCFPHDRQREREFRKEISQLFEHGFQSNLSFRCVDLSEVSLSESEADNVNPFDLILCNGLLGGPIINKPEQLERMVANLVSLLAPGGLLLAANSFHGGWKSKFGSTDLKALFSRMGLKDISAGDGIGGLKF
jgi:chemotaxis methyl-accepting protein methylase